MEADGINPGPGLLSVIFCLFFQVVIHSPFGGCYFGTHRELGGGVDTHQDIQDHNKGSGLDWSFTTIVWVYMMVRNVSREL